MIPVFALGRAQELLLILGEAIFWVVLLGSLVNLIPQNAGCCVFPHV